MITGERILVTGVTGTIGRQIALHLARENEVWGIARFGDPAARSELDAQGITTRSVDLAIADFHEIPVDFTYLLHFAWMRAGLDRLDDAIRSNVEGSGLLLQHCRHVKAALVISSMGVYAANEDPWWLYSESDPIGRGATSYAATSPACKVGVESVSRFCARAFELPVTIARLNSLMGLPNSWPGVHIDAVLKGRSMVAASDPMPHSPIHIEDMKWMVEPLLDAASTTALITNWCGDEVTTVQQWMQDAADWSGQESKIEIDRPVGSPAGAAADPTRRRSITGPCRTSFADSFRTLFAEMTGVTP